MSLYSGLSLGKNRPTEDGGDPKSDGSGSNPGGSSAPTESQSVNSSAYKRPDSASEKPGLPGGDGGDRDSDSEDIRSNVVVLCNMVRPGEVDESLQQETTDECLKYGPVVKCLVYEVPGDQLPAEIAVRIFVEFEDEAAAERAKADLHSRYFDGRRVTARSFDPQRFGRYDLAPTSAEIDRVVNRRKGVSQAILENPTTTTASSTL
ncbi:hypothetical protein BJ085DRAFT_27916 [Dimargaris cristalligena]|uniref:RNA recognition motif domain-containing protein n=1 Tax=Dimargaris cristalligena TaxID=215637 RepID=A0A4Q0A297_9FUNG|nr:hypothetical protein BJ085DRAFT_27916 [Dimargaris cristalligena]|eukprot:RKP39948.1 hypothetical protein BJ085DRAFT_27916 [Dimargaris cristalligena]